MKKYILLFTILACHITITIGQAMYSWKAYPALQIASFNIPTDNKIYSLCEGNLFNYDPQTTEIYVYDRINGLHDTKIQLISYCEETQKLIVIYENGNIDLVYANEEVSNLKQLKDKNYTNLIIHSISIYGKTAYICTNFGIVALNTENETFENTYDLKLDVQCCALDDDYFYISSSTGMYKGDRTLNLLDVNNWEFVSRNAFHALNFFKNELIGYNKSTGIFIINQQYFTTTALQLKSLPIFSCYDDIMIAANQESIYIFHSIDDIEEIAQKNSFNNLTYHKGTYWASQGLKGLQPYKLENGQFVATQQPIQPNSPVRDYFCNMHYVGNRLLVAGGDLNWNSIVREGTLMYYENNTWHNFEEENITQQTNVKYQNLTSIAQDPNDPTHHFATSAGQGLYEFKDLKFVQRYDYSNSPLRTLIPVQSNPINYVRCDALQYDTEGNLWMINTQVDSVIVILKNDGTWTKLHYEELELAPNFTKIHFDAKGRLWTNSKRLDWNGIFVLDYNGTIDDTSDDIHRKRSVIVNQDGVIYEPYYYNCFAQDLNGQIWVGTSSGLFVIEDPEDFIYNDDFTYTQIKISRNDGTDYADYLFNGIEISAIAVDAANRKWIGTSSNGIYLVSEDGQETLQHFTTENSPLISDQILSITINPQTGEVMIGTFLGLVSYMSDANTPATELDKNNVRVYPNPVRPEYNGIITVDGLTRNAEVKITTITGQLVYSGHANGGLFTWNGCNQNGKRVSSGVYNIISTNAEGKKAIVNRITFIR